jgi:hypothetical protein
MVATMPKMSSFFRRQSSPPLSAFGYELTSEHNHGTTAFLPQADVLPFVLEVRKLPQARLLDALRDPLLPKGTKVTKKA